MKTFTILKDTGKAKNIINLLLIIIYHAYPKILKQLKYILCTFERVRINTITGTTAEKQKLGKTTRSRCNNSIQKKETLLLDAESYE